MHCNSKKVLKRGVLLWMRKIFSKQGKKRRRFQLQIILYKIMMLQYATYELSAKKIIKFDADPFRWDVLMTSVGSSDRWNNIFTLINSVISTWMLEEMSRTRSSSARISGNTLRPALAGLWLLLDMRAPSIFFTQE